MGRYFLERPYLAAALVLIGLIALPIAVWLDLRSLSDQNLRRQAASLNQVVSSVRSYYGSNVVGRVLGNGGLAQVRHDYHDHPGAIPIPATLSIELGTLISRSTSGDVDYRFVSDLPFRFRPSHELSPFETRALADFRARRDPAAMIVETHGSLLDQHITLATPVIMGVECVTCHNAHPESPRTDWRLGDVRGIQTVSVQQPITLGIGSFKWLLGYLALAGTAGLAFAALQFRLAGSFSRLNQQLEANNAFLAGVSMKIRATSRRRSTARSSPASATSPSRPNVKS